MSAELSSLHHIHSLGHWGRQQVQHRIHICAFTLINNYCAIIMSHALLQNMIVDIKYMVWCAVQNFICSCTYYTLVCTQLLIISYMIMHRHCLSQTTDRTHMHNSLFSILASVISPSSHLNHLDPGGLWSMWKRWDFLTRVWDLLTWKWYVTSCRNDFSTHGNLCEVTSWFKGCQNLSFLTF